MILNENTAMFNVADSYDSCDSKLWGTWPIRFSKLRSTGFQRGQRVDMCHSLKGTAFPAAHRLTRPKKNPQLDREDQEIL